VKGPCQIHGWDCEIANGGYANDCEPTTTGMMLLPPWRDRLYDGTLGPWYGPPDWNNMAARVAAYQFSVWGGGLWDYDEDAKCRGRKTKAEARGDSDKIVRYVASIKYAIPDRELDVFYQYFDAGASIATTANMTGLCEDTVRSYVDRIRKRACREHAPSK